MKNRQHLAFLLTLTGAIIQATSACSPQFQPPVTANDVGQAELRLVGTDQVSLTVGEELQLFVAPVDDSGTTFTGLYTVAWSTSSPAVATVTAAGVVAGQATGTATITATAHIISSDQRLTASTTVSVGDGTSPPAPANPLFRAINFNGQGLTIGDVTYEPGTGSNLTLGSSLAFENYSVPLNPVADQGTAQLVGSSIYSNSLDVRLTQVPNGTYDVFFFVWEDNNSETIDVMLQGEVVLDGYDTGTAGTWLKAGPYRAAVTDQTLQLQSAGGTTNLSALEVYTVSTTTPGSPGTPGTPGPLSGLGRPMPRADQGTHTTGLSFSGEENIVIRGQRISNVNGPCLRFFQVKHVLIEDSVIGPCGEEGIWINESEDIEIKNNYIYESTGGIYATYTDKVNVHHNDLMNFYARDGRGQCIQFNGSFAPVSGMRINSNYCKNFNGADPEDMISVHDLEATAADPTQIFGNYMSNALDNASPSGGGIMAGDNGGSYTRVEGNVVVNPGQYGIANSGGRFITIKNNKVFAEQKPYTNVGIYVWDGNYPENGTVSPNCNNVEISTNEVFWTNRDGNRNEYWNANNCGPIAGIDTNNFSATFLNAQTPPPAGAGISNL